MNKLTSIRKIKNSLSLFPLNVLFAFLIINIFSFHIFPQSQFQLTIGGTGDDYAFSVVQSPDGGYVLGGITAPSGPLSNQMYSVKINSQGIIQWSRTASGNGWVFASSMAQTSGGGLAFSATTGAFGGGFCIIRLNDQGNFQWSGLLYADNDYTTGISQTSDGGFVFTGQSPSLDVYVAKFNASNNLLWARTIGGSNLDAGYDITQTSDGGCAVAGITYSFANGFNDVYIVKLDSTGALQWNRAIGEANYDYANSIIQTSDGGYAVAGVTASFGSADMFIIKLNSSGNPQWIKNIGGTNFDYASCIIQTSDGGFAAAGSTRSFGPGDYDYYVVKLNSSGIPQWSRSIGGNADDNAFSIIQTSDGGFAVAGTTMSFGHGGRDMYIVKLDANGNTCSNSYPETSLVFDPDAVVSSPSALVTNLTAEVTAVTPVISSGGAVTSLCIVSTGQVSNEIPREFELYQNYPNPFNPVTTIKYSVSVTCDVLLRVYDVLGNELLTLVNEKKNPGVYSAAFNAENLPSGVYFYKLEAGNFTDVKKSVLIK